jgi:hypothetical protein
VRSKGIARETIFLIVLGIVTVSIIIYVLLKVTPGGGWTPQCNAKKYSFCAEWSVRGWPAAYGDTWTTYAPECPPNGPSQTECASIVSPTTTAAE